MNHVASRKAMGALEWCRLFTSCGERTRGVLEVWLYALRPCRSGTARAGSLESMSCLGSSSSSTTRIIRPRDRYPSRRRRAPIQTGTKRQPLPQRLFRPSLGLCSTPYTTTMPSDQSTWLISVPLDGDSEGLLEELAPKLAQHAKLPVQDIAQLPIPSFKVWGCACQRIC